MGQIDLKTCLAFENFGYDFYDPCVICGSTNSKLETRFYYAVCVNHFQLSPTEINNYKDENSIKNNTKNIH